MRINHSTISPDYIRFFYIFITISFLNMVKLKCDINQQEFWIVDPNFVKSE